MGGTGAKQFEGREVASEESAFGVAVVGGGGGVGMDFEGEGGVDFGGWGYEVEGWGTGGADRGLAEAQLHDPEGHDEEGFHYYGSFWLLSTQIITKKIKQQIKPFNWPWLLCTC